MWMHLLLCDFCGFTNLFHCLNEFVDCTNTFFFVFVVGILDLHMLLHCCTRPRRHSCSPFKTSSLQLVFTTSFTYKANKRTKTISWLFPIPCSYIWWILKYHAKKGLGQGNCKGNQRRQMKGEGGEETKESSRCGVYNGSNN